MVTLAATSDNAIPTKLQYSSMLLWDKNYKKDGMFVGSKTTSINIENRFASFSSCLEIFVSNFSQYSLH